MECCVHYQFYKRRPTANLALGNILNSDLRVTVDLNISITAISNFSLVVILLLGSLSNYPSVNHFILSSTKFYFPI